MKHPKIILGIDTSCDDTSVGVTHERRVLANIISSQDELHAPWGGVVPNLARRAHEANFPAVYAAALDQAGITETDIEAIAVTKGHGLAIALEVGIEQAKQLARRLNIPLMAIHHSEGHFMANFAQDESGARAPIDPEQIIFPALAILVAGGQTQLVQVNEFGHYEVIGETVDDAIGEAFDKGARLLGLGYPGGAELAQTAEQGNPQAFQLPRPMRQSGNLNVSYAGLKTALLRLVRELQAKAQANIDSQSEPAELSQTVIADLCASFQAAAVETLTYKVELALEQFGYQQVFLGGGVAANQLLKESLSEITKKHGAELIFPYTTQLCRDNAAMIAVTGWLKADENEFVTNLDELDRDPQWTLPS